jgi:DNA polymerase
VEKNKLLKWYYNMGVEDILDNEPRAKSKVKATQSTIKTTTQIEIPTNLAINKPIIMLGSREIIEQSRNLADSALDLAQLKEMVLNFEGCSLKKTATNTVFSDGNPNAEIMLIGEAPGSNEDLTGIPFCGDSGKLLDACFKSINYDRNSLYITNSIFWRPPGNRKPTPDEIAMCLPFVEKHIALIKPKLLILVGSTAVVAMMNINEAMSKIRQKFFKYNNKYLSKEINCCAIFHPSYLLRQPSQKKQMWHDLLLINQFIKKDYQE